MCIGYSTTAAVCDLDITGAFQYAKHKITYSHSDEICHANIVWHKLYFYKLMGSLELYSLFYGNCCTSIYWENLILEHFFEFLAHFPSLQKKIGLWCHHTLCICVLYVCLCFFPSKISTSWLIFIKLVTNVMWMEATPKICLIILYGH
jgi:hypothetical protein